ncbi:hypothetical protein [Flavobacterium zepuense]|uniref:hypothetical protein n=1 Tax=Flavobacterium zepuense TaxID=2593302 RepID=UPI00163DD10D|nr:hypothetical protein [Flavobacterium zepuense]
MNTNKKYFALMLACFFTLAINMKVRAQNDEYIQEFVQKIIPPSPTAFEISTSGNLPLNGSSGAFSYSVPLYTVKSGDIVLPIAINYFSNGVQVDQLAGIVGTNWSLSCGGLISRVMKDFPDEAGTRYYPEGIDPGDPYHETMLKNLARRSSFDGEQDWFSFNVNGISGSFYFDESLTLHLLSDANVNITYELVTTPYIRLKKFTLLDDKGYKYIFGDSDTYIERNTGLSECSTENYTYDSSWLLKEIISPKNNSVTFTYSDNTFTYNTSYSSSTTYKGICPHPDTVLGNPQVTTCLNGNQMQSKVISAINFKNNSVVFDYNLQRQDGGGKSLKEIKVLAGTTLIKDIDFTYTTPGPLTVPGNPFLGDGTIYYRTFLKDIIMKGNAQSNEPEKYAFEYYNESLLPIRLSYSKDKFGFHNGSNNTTAYSSTLLTSEVGQYLNANIATANKEVNPNVVHYGMIKKIIYPTKGYTEVTYEANADTRLVSTTTTTPVVLNINKSWCNGTVVTQSHQWVSDGTPLKIQAAINAQGTTCTTGSYNIKVLKDNVQFFNVDSPYGTAYTTNTALSCTSGFNNYAPICTTAGSTYKIILTLTTGAAYGQMTIDFSQPVTTTTEQVFYAGGARVKSIVDMSEGQAFNKRSFYYNKLSDYLTYSSTGSKNTAMLHFVEPQFYKPVSTYTTTCNIDMGGGAYVETAFNNALRFSINSGQTYSLTRQPIGYAAITEVLEKDGLNYGAIEKVFINNPDTPGQTIIGSDIFDSPASNYGDYSKDKLAEETVYDALNVIKTKKTYHYTLLSDNFIMSTIVRKNFASPGEPDFVGGVGYPVPHFSNFSIWIYRNHYGVMKLDEITEQNYFNGEVVQKTSSKSYSGQPYYKLLSESSTNSVGQSTQTTYKYAQDLVGTEQSPYMQQLVTAYRISEPVIVKTYVNGSKIAEKHFKYESSANTGNLLLPIEVHTNKGVSDIAISSATDRKLSFTKYDTNGNLLEYKMEDGVPVSIIWGYNAEYPIAKIENALYSQASAYVSALQTASNNGTLAPASFSGLRNALPNAMVNTFTYKPLLGMASQTDIKGDTTTFHYDDNGNLKFVKDKYNNLLAESTFHFKP